MNGRNTVDFEALRRKRLRGRRIRSLFILAGVMLLVLLGVYLSDLLMQRDLTTTLSDAFGAFGGPGYPVPLPGGVIRDVDAMGSNLAVLNDTNLYIFSRKGKQVSNLQQMTDKTVAIPTKNRVLCYEFGGKRVSLHSASKALYTHQFEDIVLGADLGEGGEFAVITSPRHYIAQVTAYNAKFAPMMRWYSPDQFVLGVTVSPGGNMMVAAALDGEEGVLQSELYFLRFGMEKEAAHVIIRDELVTWLDFQTENRLAVLTERSYRLYDANGRQTGEYLLPGDPLIAFENDGESMLLLCGTREARERRLVLLDAGGKPAGEAMVEGKFLDMALAGQEVCVLTDTQLLRFDSSLKLIETVEVRNVQRIEYADGALYYLTQEEIGVFE